MSLRDLKDEIHLVLQVKGGHGFGFVSSPLVITANLAGNIHESFFTEPCPQPKFENEFVWVMDKTKLKSIWSEKIPVRLECYTLINSNRSRIGYIILNVKDAQIVQDESKITEKQIRLLGLTKEASTYKPELILSFHITDVPIQSPQMVPQFSPPLDGGRVCMADGPPRVTLGCGKEHFTLVISVKSFTNLKELLPSHSEVEPALLSYCFNLLGAQALADSTTSHSLRFQLTSSLACLQTYFVRQPTVSVTLYLGSLLIGETSFSVEHLLLSEQFYQKKSKPQARSMTCRCIVTPCHNTSISSPSPYVDIFVSFTCETPVLKKKSEVSVPPLLNSVGAGGDADSVVSFLNTKTLLRQQQLPADGGGETYRTEQPVTPHTLTVSVISIHLDLPLPPDSWFRLSQPGGSVSPDHQVAVSPQLWQLTVSVPRRLLQTTLTAHPPILHLGAGDRLIAEATLLLPDSVISQGKPCECREALEKGGEKVGEVVVAWSLATVSSGESAVTLTDSSVTPPTQPTSVGVDVLSPRARELKILSFVEELEDWAEKQRIMVMDGLKEEEAVRLASLQSRWEAEVGGQVTEGRQLVDALHSMRDQLRKQEADLRQNQLKLKAYKEELERVHRSKLQEFKDLSHRMQDEFNHKLALIAADKVALEQEVQELREENADIKSSLREIQTSADTDKRLIDNLSHELKLLKEKLDIEQESKKFFKEHCRKAEQEIYRLNCLRQQDLESRLHNEKKSLEQLAFQQIIVERKDLRQDQRLLKEIRQQLLHSTTNSSNSNMEAVYSDGCSGTDDRHIRRAT